MKKFGEEPEKADKFGFRQTEFEIMTRQEVRKFVKDSCKHKNSMVNKVLYSMGMCLSKKKKKKYQNIKNICCFNK